ncbi:MAG: bifunctional oligoribonuclease/PAP phosphatase NrnA [Gemmatimonadota bacterium]|nr:bifunctional oligoribonuclease/PAP phosphatase NrnA [Gemmatimonadota bacterium]
MRDLLAVPAERRSAIERLARELRAGRSVVLSTHINSDGDGCGSETALARMLAQRGMSVTIVNPTPWPDMFRFLLGDDIKMVELSHGGADVMRQAELVIVLDIADLRRLGKLADVVRAMTVPKLVIDHHVPSDDPPSSEILSDTSACATGELVYDVAVVLGLEITPVIANSLYVALVTDTGGFRFSNTSPRCHAVAAQLLAAGVEPEEMYQRIYASMPVGRLTLLRDALATLEVDAAFGLTWISVPAGATEKHDVRPEDLEGIAEHARSIAGTRMAIFFRDLGHNRVKISVRTTRGVDANAFANQFGGGGHVKASGALMEGSLDGVQKRVIAAARLYLGHAESGTSTV